MRVHFLLITAAFFNFANPQTPESLVANATPRWLGPINMGGRISDIAVYEKEPRIFYVGTSSGGVWKTVNGGLTFAPQFQNEGSMSLGALAVAPSNPDVVYVGTGEASSRNSVGWGDGVYRTDDGGKTWRNLGLKDTHHISRILIDPKNPDVAYVGALGRLWGRNPERGVYKTTDGGKTWSLVLSVDEKTGVIDMIMNPRDSKTLIVAMWDRLRKPWDFISGGLGSGIFKTTDAGKNWRRITRGIPTSGPLGRIGLSYFQKDPRIVIATIEYKAPPAATSAATPPAPTPSVSPAAAPVTPATPAAPATPPATTPPQATRPSSRVIAPTQKGGGVFRSTDGGESWTQINDLNPRPFYFSRPAQDPLLESRMYVAASNFHVSNDTGKTFKVQPQNIHVDFHSVWINPTDSNHIIVGEDGGVGQTRDAGATWDHLNGMAIGQFYAITADRRKPYWVYGGLQDNGSWGLPTQTRKGGPTFWNSLSIAGGDGFFVQVDPYEPNIVFAESQNGGLVRVDTKAGESRFVGVRGDRATLRFNWSTPFLISPHNPRILYIGGNRVYRSVNRGDIWAPISPDLSTNDPFKKNAGLLSVSPEDTGAERHGTVVALAESPLKPGLLYAGTDDGRVHTSPDDGKTWIELTRNFPGLPANTWCSRLTPSKWVEGRVYATFDGHRTNDFTPYLYTSEDFGKTWVRMSADLPMGDCLYVIREGERNKELLFLGSEKSLRVSFDRGGTWTRVQSGFPNVAVHDLFVHPRELDLVIGTHGRSIWTLDVSAWEQLTPDVLKADAGVFAPQAVYRLGYVTDLGSEGDGTLRAPNTQPGTRIHYWLKGVPNADPVIVISDATGARTAELTGKKVSGLSSVRWNGRFSGRLAESGEYRVTLMVGTKEYVTSVRVEESDLSE